MSIGPVIIPPVTTNFRDTSDAISPSWLNGPNGQRLRYSMHILYDGMEDGAGYAVLARYPDRAPSDAFPWLQLDRQIDQGFAETIPQYRPRLKAWLDLWGYVGSPTGLMLAMLGWMNPSQPPIRTVDNTGNWYLYAGATSHFPIAGNPAVADPPQTFLQQGNWRWDSNYTWYWARCWPIIDSSSGTPWATPSLKVGTVPHGGSGKTLGDGSCLGWAGTNGQARGLTAMARKWKAAHCSIPVVIVSYDSTMFDHTLSFGSSKLPNGNWGTWAKVVSDPTYGTVYVASRPNSTTCSFLDGAP